MISVEVICKRGILEVRMCISTQQRYKDYGVEFYWLVALGICCVVYVTQGFEPYFAVVNGNRSMDLEFTNIITKKKKKITILFF